VRISLFQNPLVGSDYVRNASSLRFDPSEMILEVSG
jgi:hypothetical protein